MPLSPNDKFGPYTLISPLGEGGMGEVWTARDTRLDRTVALKLSKAEFSERFEREARAVAALNHPNICTLYDVGPDYLVMELVEGAPLNGPLPLAKALEYAAQILDALDAAHRKGITHRDLKPANILIAKQGAKLLDFGLAKQSIGLKEADATLTRALTSQGQILGTLQYMSPEQLQGNEADPRSDIFSFGCVLYEVLSGKLAFEGASAASVIAAILERPAPSLGATLPPALDRVLQRCLAKDPDDRWQNARDLKVALLWAVEPLGGPAAEQPDVARGKVPWIVAAACLVAAGVFAALWWRTPAPTPMPRLKMMLEPPHDDPWRTPTLAPDGTKVAFTTRDGLRVRAMDSQDSQLLPGTAGAGDAAWSPDGRFLAYYGQPDFKKVAVAGGTPQTLASGLPNFRGAAWNADGNILFSYGGKPVLQVSENGGTPAPVTALAALNPTLLPDGRHFLHLVQGAGQRKTGSIYAGSLGSKDVREITEANSQAAFVAPGHLLFLRGTTLMAQPFDATGLRTTGQAVPVAEDVQIAAVTRRAGFSASRDGLIAYQTGGVGRTALAWMDRAGKLGSVLDDKHFYFDIALSPDGKQVAATRVNPNTMGLELWVTDVARGIATRIVPEGVETAHPVWSPDGRQIAYDSLDGVFVTRADGTGKQELLAVGGSMPHWSPDGNMLVFSGKDGLSLVSTAGDRKVTPYLAGNFRQAAFSPDGRWMAYVSQQSGTWEVFVESVPAGHGKWQISTRGGAQPVWRRDGAELFYMSADRKIMAVLVRTGAGFEAAAPRELLPVAASGLFNGRNHYAITADGQHFLIIPRLDDHAPMFLLQNWLSAAR